jgi:hypothetical protein
MLERFLDAAAALDGVAFERLDAVVSRWVAANPSRFRVRGFGP